MCLGVGRALGGNTQNATHLGLALSEFVLAHILLQQREAARRDLLGVGIGIGIGGVGVGVAGVRREGSTAAGRLEAPRQLERRLAAFTTERQEKWYCIGSCLAAKKQVVSRRPRRSYSWNEYRTL